MGTFKIEFDNTACDEFLASIIIPFKINDTSFLYELIDCVSNYPGSDFETIFVDDGNENLVSNAVLKKISNIRNCVFIKNESNKGVSFSRNIGIKQSRGKYLLFVDADDIVNIEMLLSVSTFLKKNIDTELLCLKFNYFNQADEIDWTSDSQGNSFSPFDSNRAIHDYLYYDKTLDPFLFKSSCGKFFRKDIILENKIFFPENLKHYEDSFFTSLYCSKISNLILCNGDVFYYYRKNMISASRTYNSCLSEQFKDYFYLYKNDISCFYGTLVCDSLYLLAVGLIKNFYLKNKKITYKYTKQILKTSFIDEALSNIQNLDLTGCCNKYLVRLKKIKTRFPFFVLCLYVKYFVRKYLFS